MARAAAPVTNVDPDGVTVLRFWNNDVLGNIEGVWEEIEGTVARLSSMDAIVPLPDAER